MDSFAFAPSNARMAMPPRSSSYGYPSDQGFTATIPMNSPQFPQPNAQGNQTAVLQFPQPNDQGSHTASLQSPQSNASNHAASPQLPPPTTGNNMASSQLAYATAGNYSDSPQVAHPTTGNYENSPQCTYPTAGNSNASPQVVHPTAADHARSPQFARYNDGYGNSNLEAPLIKGSPPKKECEINPRLGSTMRSCYMWGVMGQEPEICRSIANRKGKGTYSVEPCPLIVCEFKTKELHHQYIQSPWIHARAVLQKLDEDGNWVIVPGLSGSTIVSMRAYRDYNSPKAVFSFPNLQVLPEGICRLHFTIYGATIPLDEEWDDLKMTLTPMATIDSSQFECLKSNATFKTPLSNKFAIRFHQDGNKIKPKKEPRKVKKSKTELWSAGHGQLDDYTADILALQHAGPAPTLALPTAPSLMYTTGPPLVDPFAPSFTPFTQAAGPPLPHATAPSLTHDDPTPDSQEEYNLNLQSTGPDGITTSFEQANTFPQTSPRNEALPYSTGHDHNHPQLLFAGSGPMFRGPNQPYGMTMPSMAPMHSSYTPGPSMNQPNNYMPATPTISSDGTGNNYMPPTPGTHMSAMPGGFMGGPMSLAQGNSGYFPNNGPSGYPALRSPFTQPEYPMYHQQASIAPAVRDDWEDPMADSENYYGIHTY